jgi:hypothetical protein
MTAAETRGMAAAGTRGMACVCASVLTWVVIGSPATRRDRSRSLFPLRAAGDESIDRHRPR